MTGTSRTKELQVMLHKHAIYGSRCAIVVGEARCASGLMRSN
jgi:hypothetical protein